MASDWRYERWAPIFNVGGTLPRKRSVTLAKERQEAQRKQIEAEGIAKYQSIVRQGLTPEYLQYKGIEATMELAKSQNAKMVIIGNPKNGLPMVLQGN